MHASAQVQRRGPRGTRNICAQQATTPVAVASRPIGAAAAGGFNWGNHARVSWRYVGVCASATDTTQSDADDGGGASSSWTSATDFEGMSEEELVQEVEKAKRRLFEMRMKRATRQDVKRHEFRVQRKKVAQIKTILRQREIAQGIGKRESRKRDKRRQRQNIYW